MEAEKRKTLNRFAKVEDEISNKESEVEELSKELENSDIATDYVKAGEITDKITELQAVIYFSVHSAVNFNIGIRYSLYNRSHMSYPLSSIIICKRSHSSIRLSILSCNSVILSVISPALT